MKEAESEFREKINVMTGSKKKRLGWLPNIKFESKNVVVVSRPFKVEEKWRILRGDESGYRFDEFENMEDADLHFSAIVLLADGGGRNFG